MRHHYYVPITMVKIERTQPANTKWWQECSSLHCWSESTNANHSIQWFIRVSQSKTYTCHMSQQNTGLQENLYTNTGVIGHPPRMETSRRSSMGEEYTTVVQPCNRILFSNKKGTVCAISRRHCIE